MSASAERESCEHCGREIATTEDGERQVTDPIWASLCKSNEDNGDLCLSDPRNPDAPLSTHPRGCRCDEHAAAYGDYLRAAAKDGAL